MKRDFRSRPSAGGGPRRCRGALILLLFVIAACDHGPVAREKTKTLTDGVARLRPGPGRLAALSWTAAWPGPAPRAAAAAVRWWVAHAGGTPRDDAVAAMLTGHVDRAIAELAAAAEGSRWDARLWSDLAAAHLQRATAVSDAQDIVSALSAASRAVDLAPSLLPARFNRAIALESLSLRTQAEEDWRSYLRLERDPGWRAEAEAHLRALWQGRHVSDVAASRAELLAAAERQDRKAVDALAVRLPQLCRETVENELLEDWAEAVLVGHEATAAKVLAASRVIVDALAAHTGDALLPDTLRDLDLRRGSETASLKRLAAGFRAYRIGLALLLHGDFSDAVAALQRSRDLLSTPRSPFLGWVQYRIAVCHYQRYDYRRVAELLAPLIASAQRQRALHGRCLWLVGVMEGSRGNPIGSITATAGALADFAALREYGYVARMNAQLAAEHADLGRWGDAWQTLVRALLEPASQAEQRSSICQTAVWLAVQQGEIEAARWFQEETMRMERRTRSDYGAVEALRRDASIRAARGETPEALADLDKARALLERVPDTFGRRSSQADILLQEGRLLRESAPLQAIPRLGAAIRTFQKNSYHYALSQALFERALAEKAAGRDTELARDLAAAITESERQRARIPDLEARIEYFGRTRAVLDEMIFYQLSHGDVRAAFQYSERARARVLLDWILTQPGDDRSRRREAGLRATDDLVTGAMPTPPTGTVLLEYAQLPDCLVLWILRGSALEARTIRIAPAALGELVADLRKGIREGSRNQLLDAAGRLFEVLIRPALPVIGPGERLVFVPDGALHGLPFAILRNPKSGRYLFEDHVVSVAPSARIFLAASKHDVALAALPGSAALVVADPAFDREHYPSLRRLAGSATEASEIAARFAGSRVLRAEAATKAAFLRAVSGFRIVHFAGHAVVNPEVPLLSQLVFARDPEDPYHGPLYAGDLLGLHLPRTRLVVLASCRTATGRVSRTEGVESLARPFLAAGVPAVVASLWDVDDPEAAAFMTRFYQHLRRSFDAAAALRAAQLDALAGPPGGMDQVRTWAAFELIGASSW